MSIQRHTGNHGHRRQDSCRASPHSIEAEQGLLGSMLISPTDVIGECVERINEKYFYQPAHATIYEVLVELWNKQQPADIITLTQLLRDRKQLDGIGGAAYLTNLITFTPTAANAGYYLEIVREKYILREIIATCTKFASRAYDDQGEINTLLDGLETEAMLLPQLCRTDTCGDDPRAATVAALEELEAIYEGRQEVVGIKLGLAPLDKMLGGAKPGEMIVIAARPSVGKSALALQFAEHIAVRCKMPVGMFSLEMTERQQRARLLLSRARINLEKVREKIVSEGELQRLNNTGRAVAEAPLYIDDTAGLLIGEIRARARRWHQRFGLRMLVVDYLQLVHSNSRQAQSSREREVSEVSAGLKGLAKDLGLPLVALCQLNRDMEKAGREPRLSDLRESGSLEQDADVVLLLHRAEMQARNDEERAELAGEAKLIVAKQRSGPIGPINLTFLKEFTRFEDRAK